MMMDMCLPKFDIYRGTVVSFCFKDRGQAFDDFKNKKQKCMK